MQLDEFTNTFWIYYFKYCKLWLPSVLFSHAELQKLYAWSPKSLIRIYLCVHNLLRDAAELTCKGRSQASKSPRLKCWFFVVVLYCFFQVWCSIYKCGFTVPWALYNAGIAPCCDQDIIRMWPVQSLPSLPLLLCRSLYLQGYGSGWVKLNRRAVYFFWQKHSLDASMWGIPLSKSESGILPKKPANHGKILL